jgi:hypothetical protein
MKVLLFIILLAAAIALYFQYVYKPAHTTGTAATVSSVAPAQPAQPSGGQMLIERATGKTAVDQGMKVRGVIQKANTSNARMPNF